MENFQKDQFQVCMTSRQVAEASGKRHDHVIRDIRKILQNLHKENLKTQEAQKLNEPDNLEKLKKEVEDYVGKRTKNAQPKSGLCVKKVDNQDDVWYYAAPKNSGRVFLLSEYTDPNNRQRPEYLLTYDDVMLLVTGYDDVLRNKIINRMNELERERLGDADRSKVLTDVSTRMAEVRTVHLNKRTFYSFNDIMFKVLGKRNKTKSSVIRKLAAKTNEVVLYSPVKELSEGYYASPHALAVYLSYGTDPVRDEVVAYLRTKHPAAEFAHKPEVTKAIYGKGAAQPHVITKAKMADYDPFSIFGNLFKSK